MSIEHLRRLARKRDRMRERHERERVALTDEIEALAIEMHASGRHPLAEIGEALGLSRSRAHQIVNQSRRSRRERDDALVEEINALPDLSDMPSVLVADLRRVWPRLDHDRLKAAAPSEWERFWQACGYPKTP